MGKNNISAPYFDYLLMRVGFENDYSSPVTPKIAEALEPLFSTLSDLALLKESDNIKAIWLEIPRGSAADYHLYIEPDYYHSQYDFGDDDFLKDPRSRDYPDEVCWHRLVISEYTDERGILRFRTVSIDNQTVVNAEMDEVSTEIRENEDAVVSLCEVLTSLAADAMEKIRAGIYNDRINDLLPYWLRTGVIKSSVVLEKDPVLYNRAMKKSPENTEAPEYIGIVPHSTDPDKCGQMFFPEYGLVRNFIRVYMEEIVKFWPFIVWIPTEHAEIKRTGG